MADFVDLVVMLILIMITGVIMIIAVTILVFMKLLIVTLVPEVMRMMCRIVKLADQVDLPGSWMKVLRAKITVKKHRTTIP